MDLFKYDSDEKVDFNREKKKVKNQKINNNDKKDEINNITTNHNDTDDNISNDEEEGIYIYIMMKIKTKNYIVSIKYQQINNSLNYDV